MFVWPESYNERWTSQRLWNKHFWKHVLSFQSENVTQYIFQPLKNFHRLARACFCREWTTDWELWCKQMQNSPGYNTAITTNMPLTWAQVVTCLQGHPITSVCIRMCVCRVNMTLPLLLFKLLSCCCNPLPHCQSFTLERTSYSRHLALSIPHHPFLHYLHTLPPSLPLLPHSSLPSLFFPSILSFSQPSHPSRSISVSVS